ALVGLGIVRVETDRLVEIGDGPVEIALGLPCEATVGVYVDVGSSLLIDARERVDANSLGEIGDGGVEVPFPAPGKAAVVVGERIGRIEADRCGEVGDRPVEVTLLLPSEPASHVSDGSRPIALAGILSDTGAPGNIAIRIVGVAIGMIAHAGAGCGRRYCDEEPGQDDRRSK